MNYDVITVEGFLILSVVSPGFLAQGQVFVFPSIQKSQNNLTLSQITFWVLVLERIQRFTSPASRPFFSRLLPFRLRPPALHFPRLPFFSGASMALDSFFSLPFLPFPHPLPAFFLSRSSPPVSCNIAQHCHHNFIYNF